MAGFHSVHKLYYEIRGLLKRRKIIQDVTERKWSGILPTRFKFVGRMFGIAATLVKKLGCCG
jgi:hypothetical protein